MLRIKASMSSLGVSQLLLLRLLLLGPLAFFLLLQLVGAAPTLPSGPSAHQAEMVVPCRSPGSGVAGTTTAFVLTPCLTPARNRRSLRVRATMAPAAATSVSFEEAQEKILLKIKESPTLKPIVAQKLLEIAKELDGSSEEAAPATDELTPAERIKQGFLKFKNGYYLKNPALYKKLSAGQSPKFMVIACADSRVCPTTILGLQPGEAFMIRNVANMVPAWGETGYPSTSAALEYAVLHLKVSNILVIGHSCCGGIKALMTLDHDKRWSEYIGDWIKISQPARSQTLSAAPKGDVDSQCAHCERESVNVALSNLVTFPWIKDAVVNGNLALHGGHYSFVDGSFEYWTLDVKKGHADKF